MKYLLTCDNCIDTAKVLAEKLNLELTKEVKENPPTIRWGNSLNPFLNDTKYNDPIVIRTVSHKLRFSNYVKQMNIDLPIITLNRFIKPEKYPVVVRTLVKADGGRGLILVNNEEEFNKYKDFAFSYYKKFDFEIRLLMLGGKPVRIFKKVFKGEKENDFPIRIVENKYFYQLRSLEYYPKAIKLAEEIYKYIPINIAGFDMAWDSKEKTYYIIEINSGPSLCEFPDTLNIVVDYLKGAINE